ncbi:MAG TPA: hypothetical protein VKI65_07450, partial [Gemmataceae bacterium]|nr:hypothetical protein [Gemmataceae bacterium]
MGSLIFGLVFGWTPAAHALIARAMPLKDVLAESHLILMAQVESIDADKPAVVFSAVENLKGKASFKKLPINLTGDSEAKKLKHTPQLLKRLAPKLPLVVFVNQNGKDYIAFGYTNGTWFQFTGRKTDDSNAVRWSFTHCEPYLRGTFKGSTAELKEIVVDALAGKKEPPPPNLKEKPGLGPEVEKKAERGERRAESEAGAMRSALGAPRLTGGSVFAVIPTVFVGGPLAVLAMLFPTVFGGWQRWLAVISVACTVSTLYFVQYLVAGPLAGTWWGSPAALWAGMAATTAVGAVWAWVRFASRVQSGQATLAPGRAETISHLVLSLIAVGM